MFIERLQKMQYEYIEMKDYGEVLNNFRKQFCKLNKAVLEEKKGVVELSNAEFDRLLIRLEGKTIYESAKILRNQWILELDNGETAYVVFQTEELFEKLYYQKNEADPIPANNTTISSSVSNNTWK